jgi:hypothetical protein
MSKGTSNKPTSRPPGILGVRYERWWLQKTFTDHTYDQLIRHEAMVAKRFGCGNCGEQSAVAFMYLMQYRVSPLDYMAFTNLDHAFVVLGRPKATDDSAVSTWGDLAVVCDPWKNEGIAYPAEYLQIQWPNGRPRSIFHVGQI